MRRDQLEHAIRTACQIIGRSEVIVIGSQAILGSFVEDELPTEATMSVEIDILPLADSDETARLADLIEGVAGEWSLFEAQHGFSIDGVDEQTAVLPDGWRDRLVKVQNANTAAPDSWTPTSSHSGLSLCQSNTSRQQSARSNGLPSDGRARLRPNVVRCLPGLRDCDRSARVLVVAGQLGGARRGLRPRPPRLAYASAAGWRRAVAAWPTSGEHRPPDPDAEHQPCQEDTGGRNRAEELVPGHDRRGHRHRDHDGEP
jgi:hypothetical protein